VPKKKIGVAIEEKVQWCNYKKVNGNNNNNNKKKKKKKKKKIVDIP
jgi:hypothetical protein